VSDNEEALRAEALKRIKNRLALRSSAASYVVVNALLVVIWAITGRGYFWPGWILGGWGIGLILHALSVYRPPRPITDEEVRREMARLRG
jgi:2TM domain-containing protein